MIQFVVLTLMTLSLNNAFALSEKNQALVEESLYLNFQNAIQSPDKRVTKSLTGFSHYEQSLFVDALWDLADEGNEAALQFLGEEVPLHYDLIQKFRLGILRIKYHRASALPKDLDDDLINALRAPEAELRLVYLTAAYEQELLQAGHTQIIELARFHPHYFDIIPDEDRTKTFTQEILTDLFYKTPDVTTYMNGEYVKSVKIFMYCRTNRLYPCLMVMRNVHGEPVRLEDGKLWSNPALASSARGLPSYSRNGNTPAGVLTIDSVMPYADSQISYGKFRRMVLNFIPKSSNEVLLKSLLPESSHDSDWWKAATVARDIGRNLLRIHGTGKINADENTPYYPFMRTSGCIAQRENTYDGVTFKDQRNLLDTIMQAMDMTPSFENETHIKGVLYVVEIEDDKNAAVTLDDLALLGIE